MSSVSPPLHTVTDVPSLPPRPVDANKGTFGRVLVVAGSRGMSGAAVLCASAALRGGAGLVRLAVPEGILPIVAASNPCYTTAPLPQDEHGRLSGAALPQLLELIHGNSVAELGPGLGQSAELGDMLAFVLEQTTETLVLDADALNVLVGRLGSLRKHRGPIVMTPHPGEFARLLGCDIPTVQARRQELATQLARTHGVVMVLKGHGTVVTDGQRVYVNTTGNPGMATGGTGDVLGGLIAALLGQKLETFAAAQLGVYLHGLAGDLARERLGEVSLIATDLLDFLPHAFQQHARSCRV
ncbi:MAG TPA: NAD(P)H-hydrate dehydratase [Gemmataceae bacterium]|nr:NAD(P)H-hydrate dehydratase [Gemmataceae bacterium]